MKFSQWRKWEGPLKLPDDDEAMLPFDSMVSINLCRRIPRPAAELYIDYLIKGMPCFCRCHSCACECEDPREPKRGPPTLTPEEAEELRRRIWP